MYFIPWQCMSGCGNARRKRSWQTLLWGPHTVNRCGGFGDKFKHRWEFANIRLGWEKLTFYFICLHFPCAVSTWDCTHIPCVFMPGHVYSIQHHTHLNTPHWKSSLGQYESGVDLKLVPLFKKWWSWLTKPLMNSGRDFYSRKYLLSDFLRK